MLLTATVCLQMKGIVKQGVRCKDCGISCHKHCKDYVVVDCSKRKEKLKKNSELSSVYGSPVQRMHSLLSSYCVVL